MPVSGHVESYLAFLKELAEVRQQIATYVGSIKSVAKSFDGWERAMPQSFNGSIETAMAQWPARDSLEEIIKKWKSASARVQGRWAEMQDADKIGLKSPEEFIARG